MLVNAVRYGVPGLIALAGVVLIVAGGTTPVALGVLLIGVALLILMTNAILRAGARSDEDRAEEERAREHFSATGRWPDA